MAKTKLSRKELLKKPDEFITFSTRAIIFAKKHSRKMQYLGAVLVCLILIYLGINTYLKHINKKGQEAYNMAYYAMIKNMDPEKNQEELKKSEEIFNEVIDRYGSSKAARLALPELAYIKFQQKKYDEAITLYREFLNKVSNDPYKSLGMMALAVCYEEKGEYETEIKTLEQIRFGPDDSIKEQAMLSLARVYRLEHKMDKSNEILKEFVEKFKNSPFLPIAKAYLKP